MSLTAKKHADEIRAMWQSRALAGSSGRLRKVLITALAKEYPGAMVTLMKVTFPGFIDFDLPLYLSYAAIATDGSIVCDMMDKDNVRKRVRVYDSDEQFIYDMRTFADRLKLDDADRTDMFRVLRWWVASDKRTGINGERLAS